MKDQSTESMKAGTVVGFTDRFGKIGVGRISWTRCIKPGHVFVSVPHKAARGGSWVGSDFAVKAENIKEVPQDTKIRWPR